METSASGTGLSSERFLEAGCVVFGIEPNAEMRFAAEAAFAGAPGFRSREGRAESTGLPECAIDLVVAGQAFHWFDRQVVRLEALRILRPPKCVALMWNDWAAADSPFLADYAALLNRYMPGRKESDHRKLGAPDFDAFFGAGKWERRLLPNLQVLDFDALAGRLASASYAPKPGDSDFEAVDRELRAIFERHASQGRIDFPYTTLVYLGEIAP